MRSRFRRSARAQMGRGEIMIAMRAAFRLGHYFIDHAEAHQIVGGQLERVGRFGAWRRLSTKWPSKLPG